MSLLARIYTPMGGNFYVIPIIKHPVKDTLIKDNFHMTLTTIQVT